MIAPSARMMSPVPLHSAKTQKTAISDDRQHPIVARERIGSYHSIAAMNVWPG
jgi:hypothetical protein